MVKKKNVNKKAALVIWAAVFAQIAMIYFFTYAHIAEGLHYSRSFSKICESCSTSSGVLEVFVVTLPFLLVSLIISYRITRQAWPSLWMKKHKVLTIVGFTALIYVVTVFFYLQGSFVAR